MTNPSLIPNIKHATLALCIVDETKPLSPLYVGGTGFLISEDGFFLTATHVLQGLHNTLPNYASNPNAKIMAVQNIITKTGKQGNVNVKVAQIIEVVNIKAGLTSNYQSSFNLDISVCRLFGDHQNLEHFDLKKTAELRTFDEIFICGYPKQTLSMKQNWFDTTRTSPILQTGRIASVMPYDGTIEPEMIQTDIVATGGSSGSPIIDANDGKVIAITQAVLGVSVLKPEIIVQPDGTKKQILTPFGIGDTGLTFGITMFFVHDIIRQKIDEFKQKYYVNGKIIPKLTSTPKHDQRTI